MSGPLDVIKKVLPEPVKKAIKGILRQNDGIAVTKEGIAISEELKRRKEIKVSSNIESFRPLPLVSYEFDQALEERLSGNPLPFSQMEVVLNPYKKAPLCAVALFVTEKPCKAKFIVPGDFEEDSVAGEVSDCKTRHRLPIFGLYPGKENRVIVQLFTEDDSLMEEKVLTIKTKPLPKRLENAVRVEKHTAKSAYGLIFVSGKSIPFPYAFDSHGVIRYYMSYKPKGYGLIPLSKGRYIFFDRKFLCPTYQLPYSTQVYEMDVLGRVHKVFYMPNGCHHDACEKDSGGNLFMITNSLKGHIGDVVAEVDRDTGEIVDHLDFRKIFGKAHRDNINWIHLNTVSYDKEEDELLICARNLHSICKIKWSTKKLIWILCDPRFWERTDYESKVLKPVGDMRWCYQPHAPYWISKDQLAVFDNHWHARRPVNYFDGDAASYVKIFRIDEEQFIVSMEHSYRGAKSKITSNPRVNMEKKRVFSMEANLEPFIDGRGGMIYEYDYDTEEVLNQYSIRHVYYRGYEFSPEYDNLAKEMEIAENYIAGFLNKPKEIESNIPIPENLLSEVKFEEKEEVTFDRSDDVVYIGTKDHLLQGVYFVGEERTYFRDLSKPAQHEPKFQNIVYSIAFPIHMLKLGRYEIVVDFKGNLYDTEKYIQIENELSKEKLPQ